MHLYSSGQLALLASMLTSLTMIRMIQYTLFNGHMRVSNKLESICLS